MAEKTIKSESTPGTTETASPAPNAPESLFSMEAATARLRDFNIAAEYKYLITGSPIGLYVVPQQDDIRKLHGVLFLHGGMYKNGIFRFRIDLPPLYNSLNTHPVVTFTPPIFNPLIDMATGKLELTCDKELRTWDPERHYLVTCVTFIKKAFFRSTYDEFEHVPNEEARRLFQNRSSPELIRRVEQAVNESIERLYDVQSASSPLVFTEPKPAHEEILRSILRVHSSEDADGSRAEESWLAENDESMMSYDGSLLSP